MLKVMNGAVMTFLRFLGGWPMNTDTRTVPPTTPPAAPSRPEMPDFEEYTPERIAEFLLNNAVGMDGYAAARAEVKALGLDPDQIPHSKPPGV
jgi:hypothetical protein